MSKFDSIDDSLVSHIIYRVPKNKQDAMLQAMQRSLRYVEAKWHSTL